MRNMLAAPSSRLWININLNNSKDKNVIKGFLPRTFSEVLNMKLVLCAMKRNYKNSDGNKTNLMDYQVMVSSYIDF